MGDRSMADPLVGFHFMVEIKSQFTGAFRECSGLGSENEIVEYPSADEKGVTVLLKVPGKLKWENITLKRGITDNMDLWTWRKLVEDGKVEEARQNGSIVMFDQANTPKARWDFVNAWPAKLSGPQLNASNNEIAVEELVIAHEGIQRVSA